MGQIKILSVFGTRPEAIKMAPIVNELAKYPESYASYICVTGQHREMLDSVLELFKIIPNYDLNVMQHSQTPLGVTSAVLTGIDMVLQEVRPDWVLVQGDTTTVMAASIAAFYSRVKVGHIEAGLRSFNKWHPYPEEINRKIAGAIADIHFAPTERARQNLLREGVSNEQIFVTGNPVIDALQWVAAMPYDPTSGMLQAIPWDKRLILVTAHRRENFGKPLENICHAIHELARQYDDVHFVYPVHLNPKIKEVVHQLLGDIRNVSLLPPLDYQALVYLMKHCYLILTDSGGIQEEAPGLGKPLLVLRETTERPEAVDAGVVLLVGTDPTTIIYHVQQFLNDTERYQQMAQAVNPYGDGYAAKRIVAALYSTNNESMP